jgi:hypothetical protein
MASVHTALVTMQHAFAADASENEAGNKSGHQLASYRAMLPAIGFVIGRAL